MKLNRKLIKSQARQIIKGKVFKLFLITIVVLTITSGGGIMNGVEGVVDAFSKPSASNSDFGDEDVFDYFDDFSADVSLVSKQDELLQNTMKQMFVSALSSLVTNISFFMSPLLVTLGGFYLLLIRDEMDKNYFAYVFKNTFNKTYFRKLACSIISGLIISLLTLLFIVPGIICGYKYYFAYTIISDNPQLGPKEAIKLSKRITEGHKGELFALDLSFLGWIALTIVTAGIMSIYTMPYINTTKAIYYENFKARALEEGAISDFDFLSFQERCEIQQKAYQEQQAKFFQQQIQAAVQQVQYVPVPNNSPINYAPVVTPAQPQQVSVYTPVHAPVQPQPVVIVDEPVVEPKESEIKVHNDSSFGSNMTTDYYNGKF